MIPWWVIVEVVGVFLLGGGFLWRIAYTYQKQLSDSLDDEKTENAALRSHIRTLEGEIGFARQQIKAVKQANEFLEYVDPEPEPPLDMDAAMASFARFRK